MKTALALSFALATLAGCSGSPVPASKPAALPAATAAPAPSPAGAAATVPTNPPPTAALVPTAPDLSSPVVFHYEPKGRRDPFEALELKADKTALAVTTAKLTGIVRNPLSSMALIETQDGIGYILKPGDTLFDGRLVHIGVDSVVFTIASPPGSTTNQVVLKLAAN